MPYEAKGKCVYKKDTGKKVGCTEGSVEKYLAALHMHANESIDYETLKQIIKEEIKQTLNEQQRDQFAGGSLPSRIDTRSTTPAKRILQKAKKDFIKINIGQKLPQIYKEFAGTTKKPLTDQNKEYISRQIINYINKVRLDFVCTGDSCRPGQIRYKSCPKDPDGMVENMFYSEQQNAILLCNWDTQWSNLPLQKLALAFAHELGHAKSYAIGRLAVTAGRKKEKYVSQQKTGGEGEAMPAYGASLYKALWPYFNVSNKPNAPPDQQPEEVNAMREQALQYLGRAKLIPEDFLVVCEKGTPKIMKSWKRKTPTARNLSGEDFMTFELEFKGLKLWTKLKKRACRNIRGLRKTMNSLARADQPKGLPGSMTA